MWRSWVAVEHLRTSHEQLFITLKQRDPATAKKFVEALSHFSHTNVQRGATLISLYGT